MSVIRSPVHFPKDSRRLDYFQSHMSKLHPAQAKLREETKLQMDGLMLTSADSTRLLTIMLKSAGAKKCIDVGVFTGYSALSWALAIPEDGKVVACDISSDMPERVGKPIWKEAGVNNKIDLRIGAATETLQSLIDAGESGSFDFMFIDADKESYDQYYELGLKLIKPGGIIAIDNAWWSGNPANPESDQTCTMAIRKLNTKVKDDDRVTAVLIDAGDGINICLKN